jgi:Flp pilus assembly pilin Flp
MAVLMSRLWSDESGQDLIEYALLTAFVGLAGFAGIGLLSNALNATYTSWDAAGQSDALVEVPEP